MKLDLDRTQAQAVAAACQVAAYEWAHGTTHSQKWAKIVNEVAAKIVMSVMENRP